MTREEAIHRIENHIRIHSKQEPFRACHIQEALKLAIDALKAQEPRVLTLDEYRAIAEKPAEERVPVWLEWRGRSGRWTIPERAYAVYGVSWRCWSGKPGEDEREAVKWE